MEREPQNGGTAKWRDHHRMGEPGERQPKNWGTEEWRNGHRMGGTAEQRDSHRMGEQQSRETTTEWEEDNGQSGETATECGKVSANSTSSRINI